MDQRSRFIAAYRAGGFTMTELCARYQISRRVGYKWIARYDADGRKGSPTAVARRITVRTR
jgi:putative transposase